MSENSVDQSKNRRASPIAMVRNGVISLFILAVGVGGLVVYGKKGEVPTESGAVSPEDLVAAVRTAAVTAWEGPFDIEVDGEASTYRVVTVGAEVAGRIIRKPSGTRNGNFVSKGDVLLEIDPTNYRLEVQKLTARLQQADEELNSLDVDIRNTEAMVRLAEEDAALQAQQLVRLKSLWERRATSEIEVDTAQKQELTARNALQTQQNQRASLIQQKLARRAARDLAASELARAEVDLQRCRVTTPISGRVVDDLIEEGDFVKVGDPLMHISDSSRMEVKCSLRAEEIAWIWQQDADNTSVTVESGTATENSEHRVSSELTSHDPFRLPRVACDVSFDFDGVETIWKGVLDRYEGTGIDRETRMFPCRIVVDEPEQRTIANSAGGRDGVSPPTLLSGMYVKVRIPVDSPTPLLQLPVVAVRPGDQIWVVRDGMLRIVRCVPVTLIGDVSIVRQEGEALRAGDQVVISPLASVVDGMKVQIVEQFP